MIDIPGVRGFLERIFTRQERLALAFIIGVTLLGWALLRVGQWSPFSSSISSSFVRLQVAVNTANRSELASLPGIGPRLAHRIVEDRYRHGRFLTLTDLKRVKGITPKTLSQLEGLVRFD